MYAAHMNRRLVLETMTTTTTTPRTMVPLIHLTSHRYTIVCFQRYVEFGLHGSFHPEMHDWLVSTWAAWLVKVVVGMGLALSFQSSAHVDSWYNRAADVW